VQKIEQSAVVAAAIQRAKASAPAYRSNWFTAPSRLERWIEHGELWGSLDERAALFLRRDRDFWHLYYSAASPAALREAVAAAPVLAAEPVVADVVGGEPALVEAEEVLAVAGFRRYQRLFRMQRTSPAGEPPPLIAADPRVLPAASSDSGAVLNLLLRSFDARAEQIPMPYEIQAAIEAGQIRVVRCQGAMAGILFSETWGLTSTLRYWLVDPEFRGLGVGAALMHRYLAESPGVRRFLLWVIDENVDTIRKYKHYGYVTDGLLDQVFANSKV